MPLSTQIAEQMTEEYLRVDSSLAFSKALKLRSLLRWLVEAAIRGDSEAFSQYAIATGALGYPERFDATSDSAVRATIKRLRERLFHYYETEGRANRQWIRIEDGQYEPELVAAKLSTHALESDRPVPAPGERPTVLVLPFLPVGFDDRKRFCPL